MKKIMILIGCIAIVLGTMVFTKDKYIHAANIDDTFVEGDFTYKVTNLGNATTNGKVKISDYDETSATTNLVIPETVDYDGKTFDIVGASGDAFDNADKVETLAISKMFVDFLVSGNPFLSQNNDTFEILSNLTSITVDEANPTLKVLDGVLYNMTSGYEIMLIYPYNSNKTEFVVPDFIGTSRAPHARDVLMSVQLAKHLESIVMNKESDEGLFTINGILCAWNDYDDHTKGLSVYLVPAAKKRVVFSKEITNFDVLLRDDSLYHYKNQAEEFIIENKNNPYYSKEGCIYTGDTLVLYPGGKKDSIYKISEGTTRISNQAGLFIANRNIKSVIIPSTVQKIEDGGIFGTTLKSIKIEGTGNITWDNGSFVDFFGRTVYRHIYTDNGNTTIKTQMQALFPHLTDDYFHELGAVPTTSITNVKTTVENSKDIKLSWTSSKADTNFEVRRYNVNGNYRVVAFTKETSFVDTNTEYNTTYQYEVVPYNLPVTSSNDSDDVFRTYRTFGTASQKKSMKTPAQTFVGTYVYKNSDGSEVTIDKEVEANSSALEQAPKLPEVNGYEFDKWEIDLTDSSRVDKDFKATAVYKEKDTFTPDVDKPEDKPIIKPEQRPDSKPNNPTDTPSDSVKTGDQTNILIPTILLMMAGALLIVVRKKHNKV